MRIAPILDSSLAVTLSQGLKGDWDLITDGVPDPYRGRALLFTER